MKVALCFIISYDHSLNKEDIWREWTEANADIINAPIVKKILFVYLPTPLHNLYL
jgi:hypothetical protein